MEAQKGGKLHGRQLYATSGEHAFTRPAGTVAVSHMHKLFGAEYQGRSVSTAGLDTRSLSKMWLMSSVCDDNVAIPWWGMAARRCKLRWENELTGCWHDSDVEPPPAVLTTLAQHLFGSGGRLHEHQKHAVRCIVSGHPIICLSWSVGSGKTAAAGAKSILAGNLTQPVPPPQGHPPLAAVYSMMFITSTHLLVSQAIRDFRDSNRLNVRSLADFDTPDELAISLADCYGRPHVYVGTPERLGKTGVALARTPRVATTLIIDEAHALLDTEFRCAMRNVHAYLGHFKPVHLALSLDARDTAVLGRNVEQVRVSISLGQSSPTLVLAHQLERTNLSYQVCPREPNTSDAKALVDLLKNAFGAANIKHLRSLVVSCFSKRQVEDCTNALKRAGLDAVGITGSMPGNERLKI